MSTHILWTYEWHHTNDTNTSTSARERLHTYPRRESECECGRFGRARAFDRWSCVIYLYVCFIRHFNEQSYGFIWPFVICVAIPLLNRFILSHYSFDACRKSMDALHGVRLSESVCMTVPWINDNAHYDQHTIPSNSCDLNDCAFRARTKSHY